MDVSPDQVKPRQAWKGAVLSLVLPGLGQLYGGRPGRALAIYLGFIALVVGLLFAGVPRTFGGLILFLLAVLSFLSWVVWDAIRVACRAGDYVLKPFNRWYVYLAVWLVASFVIGSRIVESSPFKTFRIPSQTMEPAVRAGDHVYANMNYYRFSKPARGDLVLFSLPRDPRRMMTSRVIGLEGEEIEVRDKIVYIDGQRLTDPWGRHGDPTIHPVGTGMQSTRDNFGPLKIPAGAVFLLCDNRDACLDSRFLGSISDLRGRPLYVYWATDRSRIGASLK